MLIADGDDTVGGGAGYDTLLFTDDEAHSVDMESAGVEEVVGGDDGDVFSVSSDYNKAHLRLYGGGGDDVLKTGTGRDELRGGGGDDALIWELY